MVEYVSPNISQILQKYELDGLKNKGLNYQLRTWQKNDFSTLLIPDRRFSRIRKYQL